MTTLNKSKKIITNYSVNNSFANFQKKFGNKLYNNLNIKDKTFTTKGNALNKFMENNINKNTDILKTKTNTNNLIIDYGYIFSNKYRDKFNISGDKYLKKKKPYISSLPCSIKKKLNTNNNTSKKKEKKENDIANGSSKKIYTEINSSLISKYKNKIKEYIKTSLYKNKPKNINKKKSNKRKIYTKRIIDNSLYNLALPNSIIKTGNESILDKNSSNYKINSDLNSFDFDINRDNSKIHTKINSLRKEKDRKNEIIINPKDNKYKSIKVNKNICLDKISKTTLNSINNSNKKNKTNNSNNYKKINSNNINNKKNAKNKTRLQSCKFTNDQKQIILENNYINLKSNKKLSETKKNKNLKHNQSSSTKERKNITFFNNYMKNNNYNNQKKHYYTNSNITSFIINNSTINRNNYSNLNNTNTNINSSKRRKKRRLLYKVPLTKEIDLLNKIKMKLKTKPITTLHSKVNSKGNLIGEDLLNNSIRTSKHSYAATNTNINNKIIHNTKKIYINNIINVNANNTNNDIKGSNNCNSYRVMGPDKIQSYKNQIINISARTSCFDYSYLNKSQKHIYQNQINKINIPIKEIISNKNNQSKNSTNNNNNKNKDKKNKNNKKLKTKTKKIKINKDLIKKEINSINNKKDLSGFYIFNSNQNNLANIFKELNSEEVISENVIIETNPSIVSTLKECTYYKQECEKLSSYIVQYYQKHKDYPNTSQEFYKYGRILGKGAFGKVNLALHLASGRLVAIKSFNKKKLTTKRAKRKIKTEIEALSKLRNPFCTQIYDYFETDTHILIVMEYVCGDLLGYIRKRAKISESTAKIIFKQIIKGLQYIHKKKIVHRDIKLDNVLIDLTNTVKICDFGVCRILQPGDIMYEHCGTPAYIAPEIFKDEGYEGFACDIWSAGVTLYYMLAGMQPFKADKVEDLKEVILKGEFDPIENVSKEANDLIEGMLQLNPNKRFTIEDILKHPWLKNVNIKNREKLNIFTNAEKGLLSKYDVNYLNSPKEELIEVFTITNLQTKEEKEEKGATKSEILAPYNSYAKETDNNIYPELKIQNNICRFNFKAQLSNIKYELSNNQEFDNGIIKTIYNSFEEGNIKKYDYEFGTENMNTLNLSLDSIGTFTCGLCDDIIKDIGELIGYDKKYLVQCLRKNVINYATATYYLMLKDELNTHY